MSISYLLSFRINNLILVSGAKTLKKNYSQKTRILNAYSLSGINNKNNATILQTAATIPYLFTKTHAYMIYLSGFSGFGKIEKLDIDE